MIKKIFFSVLFSALTLCYARAEEVDTYSIDTKDFNVLQVLDDINVTYRTSPDSVGMAVFTCSDTLASAVLFSNSNGRLKIQRNDFESSEMPEQLPEITVYSSSLTSVENSGTGTVIVESPSSGEKFKARIIGNGTIIVNDIYSTITEGSLDTGKGHLVMNGKTRSVKLKNIGTGRIEAGGLSAETGSVSILGTGAIDCSVSQELTIKGMGSGKVYVKGNPVIKKRSLGSISVVMVE